MKHALLDTNILFVPARFKVDIFTEIEKLGYTPLLPSCVLGELKLIAKGKGKAGSEARIALVILEKKKVETIDVAGPVDNTLLEQAVARGCAIATNDIKLIARAKKKGITVLRLRQEKYIVEA